MTEAEKINMEGAKDVLGRFKRRKEFNTFGLDDCKALELIIALAREEEQGKARTPNPCLNCAYTAPWHGRFSWTGRYCSLGINDRNTCHMRVKIVELAGAPAQ